MQRGGNMSKLFKIGEISKKCNVSIKTLRYYEDFGLIKPAKTDIYSGYRYYDEGNLETIYKILTLKELGFSLQEIKEFDNDSFDKKLKDIKKQLKELKKNLKFISFLKNSKGELIMKPFINDENAVGKWQYECSAETKENYLKGDFYVDADALVQELYFLPKGKGYWIFDGWTKGLIYHFRNRIYKYEIEGSKLFLQTFDENQEYEHTLVFNRVDSKEYTKDEISKKDNTDMPFVLDKIAVGSWTAVEWIGIDKKDSYVPSENKRELFLKGLSLLENGDCFIEYASGEIAKNNWTKNYILSHRCHLASNFIIKDLDEGTYLIMDWKSGDYVYGGEIYGCYVFKKN